MEKGNLWQIFLILRCVDSCRFLEYMSKKIEMFTYKSVSTRQTSFTGMCIFVKKVKSEGNGNLWLSVVHVMAN